MKVFHKWIILAALLFLALASYSYGFSNGVFAFVALGIIFGKTQRSSKTVN